MLKGLRAETMSFKNTLDKLGVSVEVEHAGKYKDFGDMFTRPDMSPETREVLNSVVDDLYGNLVARIAAARKKSPEEVRDIIDRGPFTAPQALRAGLVDELRFEDEMWTAISSRLGGSPKKVSLGAYVERAGGVGGIARQEPDRAGGGGGRHCARRCERQRVRRGGAHLLRIRQSTEPGGERFGHKGRHGAHRFAGRRGYGVGRDLAPDEPAEQEEADGDLHVRHSRVGRLLHGHDGRSYCGLSGTLTGSIGVVYGKPNLHGLYDKLGVTKSAIDRGKHADIDSDYTPLSPEERAILRQGIDESYRDFVSKVAAARHRGFDEIEPLAEGRVWLGSQAVARGLVDRLGGLDAAVDLVKKKAVHSPGEQVTVDVYPEPTSILDMLFKRSSTDDLLESPTGKPLRRHAFPRLDEGRLSAADALPGGRGEGFTSVAAHRGLYAPARSGDGLLEKLYLASRGGGPPRCLGIARHEQDADFPDAWPSRAPQARNNRPRLQASPYRSAEGDAAAVGFPA